MRHALPILAGPLVLFLFACSENPAPAAPKQAPSDARHDLLAAEEDEAQLDVPLAGLTPTQLARFNQGREVFTRVFSDATGLGPSFNSESCANCHEEPSVGGVGDDVDEDVESHVSVVAGNACDDLAPHGGVVIQQHTTALLQSYFASYTTEAVPALATKVGRRSTPAVFGFGLLDAVSDATILALADPNDANGDGVSGRAHMVNGHVGKFGRKATDPSLLVFNAGAFQNEIGVTNNLALAEQRLVGVDFPFDETIDPIAGAELSDSDLSLANDFVRFLRPPPQARLTIEANDGRDLFLSVGCATCHVPSLRTGASTVNALSGARVEAFTDLLLYDMGPALADICRGDAKPAEFRTEPLMGLRFKTNYMHDAGSSTLADAIARHDGEAAGARTRFNNLSAKQRTALFAYLATL